MKCKNCNSEMILDDKDFNFEGCYDNYWICSNCNCGCVEKIRFNKIWKIEWNFLEE